MAKAMAHWIAKTATPADIFAAATPAPPNAAQQPNPSETAIAPAAATDKIFNALLSRPSEIPNEYVPDCVLFLRARRFSKYATEIDADKNISAYEHAAKTAWTNTTVCLPSARATPADFSKNEGQHAGDTVSSAAAASGKLPSQSTPNKYPQSDIPAKIQAINSTSQWGLAVGNADKSAQNKTSASVCSKNPAPANTALRKRETSGKKPCANAQT